MSEIELHRGTPFLSSSELNRLARQQELSVVMAKAHIFDQICQEVTLPDDLEAELIQTFLQQEAISDDSELEDYLVLRGWQEADLIYVATKAERLQRFQQQVFGQEVEINYLGRKIDLDQVSYHLICVQDADEAFEWHQRLLEGEVELDQLKHITAAEDIGELNSGRYGPQAIGQAHPSLISRLRVGDPPQVWPPFISETCWVVLQLDQRVGTPLDDSIYAELLDELFDAWLHKRIRQLLIGQDLNNTSLLPGFTTQKKSADPAALIQGSNHLSQQQKSQQIDKSNSSINEEERTQDTVDFQQIFQSISKDEREKQSNLPEDPIAEWNRLLEYALEPTQNACQVISFENIFSILSRLFPPPQTIKPKIQTFENVLWIRSSGGLFDRQTGMVIPGTYMCRFPRQRQHPHLDRTWTELVRPITAYPRVKESVYLPFANGRNFGHFATETLGHLWPFITRTKFNHHHQKPTFLHECTPKDPFAQTINLALQKSKNSTLFDQQLPNALHLETVHVPEPSLRLQAYASSKHIQAGQALGDIILRRKTIENEDTKMPPQNIYISRSKLPDTVRKVHEEIALEKHLRAMNWLVFHPQNHFLSDQIKIYRHATCIAGFEGSALHCLTFIGKPDNPFKMIFLGDSPSVDYFLQFRAQDLSGTFIHCTKPDDTDSNPSHLKKRNLLAPPKELAELINSLS